MSWISYYVLNFRWACQSPSSRCRRHTHLTPTGRSKKTVCWVYLALKNFHQISWLVTSGWGKSRVGWAPAKGPSPKIWQRWQRLQLVCNMYPKFWSSFSWSFVTVSPVGWVKLNQQWICLFSLTLGLHIGICLVYGKWTIGHPLQYNFPQLLLGCVLWFRNQVKWFARASSYQDSWSEAKRIGTKLLIAIVTNIVRIMKILLEDDNKFSMNSTSQRQSSSSSS